MRNLLKRVESFVHEHLELRGKMDEPTLKKHRIVFGIHVRIAAEVIGVLGFIIYALHLSGEFYRHRYLSFAVSTISAICYLLLVFGINKNRGWAHWPYFFINPVSLFVQIIILITSHLNAAPSGHNPDAKDDHFTNMVVLVLFIGALLLLHGYCIYIVYRSYKYLLNYLHKHAEFSGGEEMMDFVRTPEDAETTEIGILK